MVDQIFPYLSWAKWIILQNFWKSDELVVDLKMPLLYVTGKKDEIVPTEMTLELYAKSNNASFKELLEVENGTHNDTWFEGGMDYIKKLEKFIQKCKEMDKGRKKDNLIMEEKPFLQESKNNERSDL